MKNSKEVNDKSRKTLLDSLKEKRTQLVQNSKDASFANTLIDGLITIQKQLDVESTLIHVPVKNIIKEHDYNHFQLIETKDGIVFKVAGYACLIRPMQQSFYGHLYNLLDFKEKYDGLTDEEKEIYDDLFYRTSLILLNPLLCFADDEYFLKVSELISKEQERIFTKMSTMDLKEEDPEKDDQFMEDVKLSEESAKMFDDEEHKG